MRTTCLICCALALFLLLLRQKSLEERRRLESEKLVSIITPESEHLFAKTCAAHEVSPTEQELGQLAERYRTLVEREFGIRCTVRWEYVPAEAYWLCEALQVRVFVKQHPMPQ